ncbi:MAG: DUF2236 domain-containing protein [Marinobacter sp.]|nr:DUF2236 domain-containing protein [Marinobacter sp.]
MNAQTIPLRHGANRRPAERQAKPLLMLIRDKHRAIPAPHQWASLGQALLEGDPIADDLAAWLCGADRPARKQAFEQALHYGIASLPEADEPLRAFFAVVESAPTWLDRQRLNRGMAACAVSGRTGMRVLRDLGLMAGYQASAINRTLVMTGALQKGAAKRVAETTKWWMDCTTPGGLEILSQGYRSTVQVRLIHAMVRRHLQHDPEWDTARWGLPINQVDMQATYLAFSVLFIVGQRALGTWLRQQEAEDIMHLWRYIAWLMGVKDDRLSSTFQDGLIALYQNLLSQDGPDASSQQLGRALMDEPLARHYALPGSLPGQWEKQVHLSIIRWFVGRRGLKALGLPTYSLPWYPLIFMPANALWCVVNRAVPGGKQRLVKAGRASQERLLRSLFGSTAPAIRPLQGER